MNCPYCGQKAEYDEDNSVKNSREVIDYFFCDCGCIFKKIYCFVDTELLQSGRPTYYQTETERDNPRDPVIERS